MEEFSVNCSFILTCNYKNKIIQPLHSRCSVVEFKIQNGQKAKMALQFLKRVEGILEKETVTYEKDVIASVITKHFPDNRRILNELQRYASNDARSIDKGILSVIADVDVNSLVKMLREKDFNSSRKWVTNNVHNDAQSTIRGIYEGMSEFLKAESIPQAVLILSKYQYQSAFVADQEINLMACLTEFMVECEFK